MTTQTIENKSTTSRFLELKRTRDTEWANILEQAKWAHFILHDTFDARFYGIYLIETYHYVMHNPKHQALVGAHMKEKVFKYIKFCFEHAEEETGHEMMALHDLLSLGLAKDSFRMPEPHPDTEVFIAYLYWISTNGNYLQRLGYSFWAEDSYQYIRALMERVQTTLNLQKSQMTFLVSHATIDEKHAEEIDEMINEFCKTDDDWQAVEKVLKTSLSLQSKMLDSVLEEYLNLKNGGESRYHFLNSLVGA
ncbi:MULTISPECIES: iron-containing redox enzyme family protein [unclassified Flavobacterium]|uniref:iron-containing redox enzyme family protein n=1 Tax=unclassified Flavobacterium TaxID=196869 RepID=UPI001F136671|nr:MULTISPECIES: iron-containing redox enzyme family protein [unclassified Flavobacterium]UMY66139.1 iron-containing redox enzyme family protein [Flavobacterium sp. HJ-32-4]